MSKNEKVLLGLIVIASLLGFIFNLFGKSLPEKIIRRLHRKTADIIKNDPHCIKFTNVRSAITGESFKPEWINAGMVPLTSDQGFILATHGNWHGEMAVGVNESGPIFVDPKDDRFANVWYPGTRVLVVACYPGYRPGCWIRNGVTFFGISDDAVPVYFPCVDGTAYYCPMPFRVALALKMI